MENREKSGLFISNTQAYKTLVACEEILGKGGIRTVLRMADLPDLIDNYPPDNIEKAFDYTDYTSLMTALEDVYGKRGGRIMGMRIGRAMSGHMREKFGKFIGVTDIAFKVLPLHVKMHLIINAFVRILNKATDVGAKVVEQDDCYIYSLKQCPICWDRHDVDQPVCFNTVGFLRGLLHWISNGKEFDVREIACHAHGNEHCVFRIPKNPIEA